MRVTIDYSDMKEPERSQKALADIENYLGKERMEQVEVDFKSMDISFNMFQGSLGLFVGIEGFPVEAWYEKLFPGRLARMAELNAVIHEVAATVSVPHDGTGAL